MKIILIITTVFAIFLAPSFAIEETNTIKVYSNTYADLVKCGELRPITNQMNNLLRAGKTDQVKAQIGDLLDSYKRMFDPKLKQYSFSSKEEYADFNQTATQPFEWIDWGYAETLHIKASIEISFKDYDDALETIKEMTNVAPCSAFALGEEGFILSKLKKKDEALIAYQKSYDLGMKYKTQNLYVAKALRGKGSVLIDLNQLDEAEIAFNQSLEIEPNNRIALSELEYIRAIRRKNKNS